MMRKSLLILLALLLVVAVAGGGNAQNNINLQGVCKHITSATTTNMVAAVAGSLIEVWSVFIYVDAGGVTTAITLQDTAGTNLAGTGVTWTLPASASYSAPLRGRRYYSPTAVGTGLNIVTNAAGPVEACVEYIR